MQCSFLKEKVVKNLITNFVLNSLNLKFDDTLKFIKKGVMIDMYKNRWGILGFILRNFAPKVKNSCDLYIFKLN